LQHGEGVLQGPRLITYEGILVAQLGCNISILCGPIARICCARSRLFSGVIVGRLLWFFSTGHFSTAPSRQSRFRVKAEFHI
jgi:hypothetical protein